MFFFFAKACDLFLKVWTTLLDIFYVFKGKIQQNLCESSFKRILFQFPHGSRQISLMFSQDVSLPSDCCKAVLSVDFKFILSRVHSSPLADGNMANSNQEAIAALLSYPPVTLWALHTQQVSRVQSYVRDPLWGIGSLFPALSLHPPAGPRWVVKGSLPLYSLSSVLWHLLQQVALGGAVLCVLRDGCGIVCTGNSGVLHAELSSGPRAPQIDIQPLCL